MRGKSLILALTVLALGATMAAATPDINSAVIIERVFNDCPTSDLTTGNFYPGQIYISDMNMSCYGYANLHVFRLSTDGATPAVFDNDSNFRIAADMQISGPTNGEAGLNISPWWSQNVDGRFNVRIPDGEIAVFGGRLPFYSFTANYGLTYVQGTMIHLEMIYYANGLNETDPATVEYKLVYNNTAYSSGALPFDMGNPAEPYGLWGMLNDGRVGGYAQILSQGGNPDAGCRVDYFNIEFENLDVQAGACCYPDGACLVLPETECVAAGGDYYGDNVPCDPNPCPIVPVEESTWGQIKSRYSN